MKNWLLSFLLIVLITSCKENEEDTTSLDVSNINLIDVGHGTSGFDFEAHSVGDSLCECMIRVRNIKKGDSIATFNALLKGNDLTIDIVSSPYDFECNDDSCFTVHELYFNLNIVPKEYSIFLNVNNICGESEFPCGSLYLVN
jgi:hypothetical protein